MRFAQCRFAQALAISVLAVVSSFAAPQGQGRRTKIAMLSIGDKIENKGWIKGWKPSYNSKAEIENEFRGLADKGCTVIYWRMLGDGAPRDEIRKYSYRLNDEEAQFKKQFENTPYAWDPYELRWPIAVAHRLGMKLYAWVVPYNMGAPP